MSTNKTEKKTTKEQKSFNKRNNIDEEKKNLILNDVQSKNKAWNEQQSKTRKTQQTEKKMYEKRNENRTRQHLSTHIEKEILTQN